MWLITCDIKLAEKGRKRGKQEEKEEDEEEGERRGRGGTKRKF